MPIRQRIKRSWDRFQKRLAEQALIEATKNPRWKCAKVRVKP